MAKAARRHPAAREGQECVEIIGFILEEI